MTEKFILQMRPFFGEEEKKAIQEYLENDGFVTEYKQTQIFEEMIADYTGSKYCVVVNNGTISLTLAAMVSGIQTGDEVIIPNYTMVATPNSFSLLGAKPVFVDVEPETLCLDITKVRKAINNRSKAMMLVSANGRYPLGGIEPFEELAKEKGLILIEDAAQSLGSYYPDGRHIGRAGLIGSFSFSTPKIISTGQGGALITDDKRIAEDLRKLKNFGRSSGGNDIHDSIGFNFKFTDIQACIGIQQMKKLDHRVLRKKEIWSLYRDRLSQLKNINLFPHELQFTSPWFIDSLVESRLELSSFLKEKGIGTRVMYPPLNKQRAYLHQGEHHVSNLVGKKGLWLPSAVQLTDEEINYICDQINNFYKS